MAERTMHLAVNTGAGSLNKYGAFDADEYVQTALIAERALLDAVFLPNVSFMRPEGPVGGGFDPILALTLMAQATSRIGLVATLSVTLHQPYTIARAFASLEHLSKGRVGWNVVTTRNKPEGLNYGYDPLPDRHTRYASAIEAVEIVTALWDSWQEGAVVRKPDGTVIYDRTRITPINYAGEHFSVAGPLQIPSFPNTRPIVTQAGGSDDGIDLAGRCADAVFSSALYVDQAQEYYAKLKSSAAGYGRDPATLAVLPGLTTVVGSTEVEARRNASVDALSPPELDAELRKFAKWAEVNPAALNLDEPFPTELIKISDPTFGSVGFDDSVRQYLRRNRHRPVRELVGDSMQGSTTNHRRLVGTPEQIADDIEHWYRSAACDGFILMSSGGGSSGLQVFADEVVPLLQRRGLFRREYAGTTLREHLGIGVHSAEREPA